MDCSAQTCLITRSSSQALGSQNLLQRQRPRIVTCALVLAVETSPSGGEVRPSVRSPINKILILLPHAPGKSSPSPAEWIRSIEQAVQPASSAAKNSDICNLQLGDIAMLTLSRPTEVLIEDAGPGAAGPFSLGRKRVSPDYECDVGSLGKTVQNTIVVTALRVGMSTRWPQVGAGACRLRIC